MEVMYREWNEGFTDLLRELIAASSSPYTCVYFFSARIWRGVTLRRKLRAQ